MSPHARLAPSSAHTWVHCPGSVVMCEQYPDDSTSGEEGEAAHWAAAFHVMWSTGMPAGTAAPNGVVLTEQAVKAAGVYAETILAEPGIRHIEEPMSCASIHPECWGTPDHWSIDEERWVLSVDDFKFGWGVVEARENWQLICYAAGIIDKLGNHYGMVPERLARRIGVRIRIIQPRPYHVEGPVRSWRLMCASDLQPYWDQLKSAASEALGDNPRCIAGAHCRYCKARHACGAAQRSALHSMDFIHRGQPEELPPEALAMEWATLNNAEQAIKYRKAGLEGQIVGMLGAGKDVPGLIMENQQGRRVWNGSASETIAYGDMLGANLRAPEEALTPTQARDGKLLPWEVIAKLSNVPVVGKKLKASDNTLAARVFGQKGVI